MVWQVERFSIKTWGSSFSLIRFNPRVLSVFSRIRAWRNYYTESLTCIRLVSIYPLLLKFFFSPILLCFSSVLSQRQRLRHRLRWCHLQAVWPACRPGAQPLLPWQHHLWHHLRGFLALRPFAAGWLRRLQLQHLGRHEGRPSRWVERGGRKTAMCWCDVRTVGWKRLDLKLKWGLHSLWNYFFEVL